MITKLGCGLALRRLVLHSIGGGVILVLIKMMLSMVDTLLDSWQKFQKKLLGLRKKRLEIIKIADKKISKQKIDKIRQDLELTK